MYQDYLDTHQSELTRKVSWQWAQFTLAIPGTAGSGGLVWGWSEPDVWACCGARLLGFKSRVGILHGWLKNEGFDALDIGYMNEPIPYLLNNQAI